MIKRILFAFTCLLPFLASAQSNDEPLEAFKPANGYGFFIGSNTVLNAESSRAGLSLGMEANRFLTRSFGVAMRPAISFYSYRMPDEPQSFEPAYLELPAYFVFSPFHGAVKPVLSAGPGFRVDLEKFSGSTLTFDASLGLATDASLKIKSRTEQFIIQPQLTYSYSGPIKALYFTLSFLDSRY
jgi:hypothetical protein